MRIVEGIADIGISVNITGRDGCVALIIASTIIARTGIGDD